MSKNEEIIILGGGQAAAYAAREIRSINHHSNLTILTEENTLPYERPPLSKDFLLDKMNFEKCLFFNKSFYDENKILCINDEKIDEVNLENKELHSNKNKIGRTYLKSVSLNSRT